MADLTSNTPRQFLGAPTNKIAWPIAANLQIFAGAFLMIDSNGNAANCTPTASGKFLGIAHEAKDNRTGSVYGGTAASTTAEVWQKGTIILKDQAKSSGNWAATDLNATMYAPDGGTLTDAAGTNNIVAGKIVAISAYGASTADVTVLCEATTERSI